MKKVEIIEKHTEEYDCALRDSKELLIKHERSRIQDEIDELKTIMDLKRTFLEMDLGSTAYIEREMEWLGMTHPKIEMVNPYNLSNFDYPSAPEWLEGVNKLSKTLKQRGYAEIKEALTVLDAQARACDYTVNGRDYYEEYAAKIAEISKEMS